MSELSDIKIPELDIRRVIEHRDNHYEVRILDIDSNELLGQIVHHNSTKNENRHWKTYEEAVEASNRFLNSALEWGELRTKLIVVDGRLSPCFVSTSELLLGERITEETTEQENE